MTNAQEPKSKFLTHFVAGYGNNVFVLEIPYPFFITTKRRN